MGGRRLGRYGKLEKYMEKVLVEWGARGDIEVA
jgi:hypothetical protein